MTHAMDRRTFVKSSAALAALAPLGLRAAEKQKRTLKKALMFGTMSRASRNLSLQVRFQMMRDSRALK